MRSRSTHFHRARWRVMWPGLCSHTKYGRRLMEGSMTSQTPALGDMQRAIRDTVRRHWQLFLAQGVIMLILGILAVIWPGISTIAIDVYVGWLFLLSGIIGLFTMFLARNVQAFLWMLLTAALSLFVGVTLPYPPPEGAASLALVLTAFFIVEGIFQIARGRLPPATCFPASGDGCW